jgi:ParB family chromosome partitioning protein
MAGDSKKRGLGRGFDSLIPSTLADTEFDVTAERDASGVRIIEGLHELEISLVDPNPHQPRTVFEPSALAELAASIAEHGVVQPLVVTPKSDGRYELIAGERRLRASKLAGLKFVPAIVRSLSEQHKLELALIENLQRADLNAVETATAYRKLMDQFNLTYEQVGKRVGKDRSTIANTVRLLGLPLEAKRELSEGKISEGHARVILSVTEPEKQLVLLEMLLKHGWSVRQAEEFARGLKGETGTHEKAAARIAAVNDFTRGLGDYLGTKVSQVATAKGGKLVIEYYSPEDLERITGLIRGR